MMTKQAFDSLRNRLKYEKLAGKHMELQAEYEALRDSLQTNDFPPGRSKVGTLTNSYLMASTTVSSYTNITGLRGHQSGFRYFQTRKDNVLSSPRTFVKFGRHPYMYPLLSASMLTGDGMISALSTIRLPVYG